jgi:protocatechuate 3,4-dioxygenase beta subunit
MAGPAGITRPLAPTVSAGRGPYYVSNTAELPDGNLNFTGLPGELVRVTGHVYGGSDGHLGLAGARIEIWHADSTGSYHPNAPGDAADFRREDLALRGCVVTGLDGRYAFSSIFPGKYPGRCRHFHVRVSAPGHRPVSTQLIFPARPGDAERPENDFVARSLPPDYQVRPVDSGGTHEVEFDFRLEPE